mmetsp:Transcript_18539/g.38579  ORF Transcript_18539/g.38579 Transcript_18539/m.38579 type:complete len:518 (-) Transcript_18539:27-1580(-)
MHALIYIILLLIIMSTLPTTTPTSPPPPTTQTTPSDSNLSSSKVSSKVSSSVRSTSTLIAQTRSTLTSRYPNYLNDTLSHSFAPDLPSSWTQLKRGDASLSRIACRTRFFDCYASTCLHGDLKARQVVILGSGYDTRFERLRRTKGLNVFEVDVDSVLERKDEILRGENVGWDNVKKVMLDVTDVGLLRRLKEVGFDDNVSTVVIAEGLLYYLEPEDAKGVLKRCRRLVRDGVGISICYSAVSGNCVGGMKGLFRWGTDDVEGDAFSCGWVGCRGFVYGEGEGGGRSFEDYLDKVKGGEDWDNRGSKGLKDGEGNRKKTYWVVGFSDEKLGLPFSRPNTSPPLPEYNATSSSRLHIVMVLGKELDRRGRITNELKGRVLRGLQLNRTLCEKGEGMVKVIFSGGKGECDRMIEFTREIEGEEVAGKIICEVSSNTTRQNAKCTLDLLGLMGVGEGGEETSCTVWVCTTEYHLRRAKRVVMREVRERGWKNIEVQGYGDFHACPEETEIHEYEHVDNRG